MSVDQMPDCSLGSVATMPAEQIGGRGVLSGAGGENLEGGGPVVAIDPPEHVAHGEPLHRGRVEEGREERAGPLVPVVFPQRAPLSRLAPTIASAVTTAASHRDAFVNGDQPTRSTPRGQSTSPLGS